MIRRPPRSTLSSSSAASDVYKRQLVHILRTHVQSKMADPHQDLQGPISFESGTDNFKITLPTKPSNFIFLSTIYIFLRGRYIHLAIHTPPHTHNTHTTSKPLTIHNAVFQYGPFPRLTF
eukprot:TRINITY_DN15522_c0_g2_i3.p1 TRINITY_DN15522_c0_g2~~TRINITY_DN15522_c0_g2_i3.p1  ORF type:complete len:120 (+),score=2.63 TRINITY_DN15522_c0_g2_i3:90-449(+)